MSNDSITVLPRTRFGAWDGLRWLLLVTGVVIGIAAILSSRRGGDDSFGFVVAVWGVHVPDWLSVVSLLHAVASLALLIRGPQPWRATRWAWFWLSGNPVTQLAFLLLSGPTPGVRAPLEPSRRLRGGWAFILSSVIGTVWVNVT